MKSDRKDKKLMAIIDNKKTVHFGTMGYEDFTTHKDEKRKQNYITQTPLRRVSTPKTYFGTNQLCKHQ